MNDIVFAALRFMEIAAESKRFQMALTDEQAAHEQTRQALKVLEQKLAEMEKK